MSGRGGRDKFRRDYPSRSEEKSHHGRNNPPSRHLWVGNLSHSLDGSTLARHFLQFGELESVAFQPGRSYAFINFKTEDDAFAAIRELQGFSVAGNPLRIEFTKAEKSTPSRDNDYMQSRDDQGPIVRASPFSNRGSRARHSSPDPPYPDKSKKSDKNVEPSEVLWIGFPAQLKVDEFILRKAFSPFGEIDKITAFPGRTYAFVRFKHVMAACRAKDTLQGKLFGNPRVHICFAKSESGISSRERNSVNASPSPHFRAYGHRGSSENIRQEKDHIMSSPGFLSNFEPSDPDVIGFGRKNNAWTDGNGALDQRRFPELGSEIGIPGNIYERHSSPSRDRGGRFREFSSEEFPRQGPFYDDPFDLPEDPLLFQGAKKLKTSSFPSENELPEYPFTDLGQVNRVPSRAYPDFKPDSYEKNFGSEPIGYTQIPDHPIRSTQTYMDRNDERNASYDGLQVGSVPLLSYPELKRSTPETHQPSANKEWKWEGTIAKGGTPVCHARCFPVGKVMDMILPEFLDCTARTSLDMLAKHYYQAAVSWVVFFVPASDPDMTFYNEFMNYLVEKQRAAVAKLDDRNTLFLVPPSDFSQNVLKVPGKLSISGVVLRSEHPGFTYGPLQHQEENKEANFASFHAETSSLKQASASRPYTSLSTPTNFERSGVLSVGGNFTAAVSPAPLPRPAYFVGNLADSGSEIRHENAINHRNTMTVPSWSPHDMQNLSSNARNITSQAVHSTVSSMNQGYNSVNRTSNPPLQEKPPASTSMSVAALQPEKLAPLPVATLQPEQLAQLASSLLGQNRQSGTISTVSDWAPGKYVHPNNQVVSENSSLHYVPMQQQQQQILNVSAAPQREAQPVSDVNSQLQYATEQEEGDTEKRLQATLQLAAALLQQIQQGKGT